jgi:hypothetical protein
VGVIGASIMLVFGSVPAGAAPVNLVSGPSPYAACSNVGQSGTKNPSAVQVSGPFNDLAAPNAGGFMLGDYSGLTASGSTFDPFFVQTNCLDTSCVFGAGKDPTDVFSSSF